MSHVLSLLVEDKPGLLTRVAGLFARRGFNIESLAVGVTEVPGLSRITVVVDVEALPLEQVTKPEEIDPAIKLALETNDRPVVIDFIVSRDAMVWPMVPQGVGNSQVQYARDHAPEWEEE